MYDIIICYNANHTVALVFRITNQLNINSIPLVESWSSVEVKEEVANVLLLKEFKMANYPIFTQSGSNDGFTCGRLLWSMSITGLVFKLVTRLTSALIG